MADFKQAIGHVLQWEGGYVNDPDDAGGETYAGITRKNWPHWEGWKHIDAAKPLKRGQFVQPAEPFVKVFYEQHYWKPLRADQITDQRVAGFLLDFYVHSGYHAVRAIQDVTGATVDGLMGPKTLTAINTSIGVFGRLKEARIAFLRKAAMLKKNKKFVAGWVRRVNSFV